MDRHEEEARRLLAHVRCAFSLPELDMVADALRAAERRGAERAREEALTRARYSRDPARAIEAIDLDALLAGDGS